MVEAPETFEALIEKWGIAQFASDLGVSYPTANAMKQRKRVNATYWPKIVEKAPERGIPIKADDLIAMQEKAPKRAA